MINDFTITSIESIEMYDSGMEMVKKNVPDDIKVSHTKFKRFCRNKKLTCHTNTISELSAYFDEYDNVVAYFIWGRKPDNSDAEYYINPKLYELSQEQKRHIQDEYAQVREPTLVWTLDDVKSVEIV